MKKLIISISLLISFASVFGQPEINRSSINNTVRDQHLYAVLSFRTPVFADTTAANAAIPTLDSVGKMIFTRDVMAHWSRVGYPKKWVRIGTVTSVVSSQSILVSGDGSPPDPYIPTLIVSGANNNAVTLNPDGVFVPTQVQNGLIEGGILTWVSGYTYDVSPARYGIQDVVYNTLQDQITFANADTLPRIDEAAVDINEDVVIIPGTPSESPTQEPSYDPLTQVPLAFVSIDSNSTAPPDIKEDIIYRNDDPGEWTAASSGPRIVDNSTTNPFSVPRVIKATLAQNNDSIGFTALIPPIMSDFNALTFKLLSGAAWGGNSSIRLQWYNGTVAVGNPVFLGNNNYGFNSSNTAVYQTITMQKSDFGAIPQVTHLRITVQTFGGATISFSIDDIRLLGGDGVIIPQVGDDWHVGGNILASTGRLGTLTPNNIDIITGNTLKATINNTTSQLELYGNEWLRGSNPFISLFLGTGANSDYYFSRNGTTMFTHTAGDYAMRFTGNNIYLWNKLNGHIWKDSLGTSRMQLNHNGSLRLYNYGVNAFTGTATKWLAVDVNGNVIEQAPPLTAVSASNALNMVGTDVQLGGLMTKSDTILNGTSGNFRLNLQGTTNTQLLRLDQAGTGGVLSLNQNNAASGSAVGLSITMAGGGRPISAIGSGQTSLAAKNATNNTVLSALGLFRSLTSGSGAVGVGTSLEFYSMPAFGNRTGAIESVMTDVTSTDEESDMNFYLINSGPFVDYLRATLHSDGNWTWPAYGTGAFTGTPAYGLAVDASGNVIEAPVGGGISGISGDNGVTENVANNIQLGGTLIQPTTIATGSNSLTISTATSGISPLIVDGTTGTVATIFATTGIALTTYSTSTVGPSAQFTINASTTNTVIDVLQINRATSGSAAIGIGASIDYSVYTTVQGRPSNQLISKWTTVTDASRVSEFSITGVDNAITSTLFKLSGNGALQFNKYGVNTFAGVAAFVLGVDASGNLVEVAAAGSGMTNVLTTTGDIIYSSSGSTPARLGIGTAGQVLRVSAGGIPEWFTTAGSGTVTSVGLTSSDITVGGSSPITGSGTFTLTLATVNGNVGSFGSSTAIPTITVNAKGLITAVTTNAVIAPAGTLTGATLASNVLTTSITSTGALASGSLTSGFTIGDVTMNVAGADATGDMYYRNASGVLVRLPIGSAGQYIASVGGIPTYTTPGGGVGTVTSVSGGTTGLTFSNPTSTPTLTGVLLPANGGTGQTTLQAAMNALGGGVTNNRVLRANGTNIVLAQLNVSTDVTGVGNIANGFTGQSTYSSGDVLFGTAGGSLVKGQILGTANQITMSFNGTNYTASLVFNPTWQTVTDAANTIWNVTNGANAVWTNNGTNRTLTIQNPAIGYTYMIRHVQGAGGSHTISTYPAGTRWPNGGAAPVLTTAAGKVDIFTFTWDGSVFWADYKLNY